MAALLMSAALSLSACAEKDSDPVMYQSGDYDPLEPLNRCIFKFNYVVDGVLIKPLAQLYRTVTPKPVQKGVSNFLDNLTSPVSVANSTLQGNGDQAFTTFWRFVLNSTLGVGGVFDFAGYYGIHSRSEDLGQTFGRYGMGPGPYLVLPIIGPATLRDSVGMVGDWYADPLNRYTSGYWKTARTGATGITKRADNIDLTDEIFRTSLDPYTTFRSGYLQYRSSEIKLRN